MRPAPPFPNLDLSNLGIDLPKLGYLGNGRRWANKLILLKIAGTFYVLC